MRPLDILASATDVREILALHKDTKGDHLCDVCTVNRRIRFPCRYARVALDWLEFAKWYRAHAHTPANDPPSTKPDRGL